MGLEQNQGELKLTRSGKGVEFIDKTANYKKWFVCSKAVFDEFAQGKRASVNFALVVSDE